MAAGPDDKGVSVTDLEVPRSWTLPAGKEEWSSVVRRHAGPVLTVIAAAWWLFQVTRSWAGWDQPAVTVGAVLVAAAAVAVRPDRVLPAKAVGLVAALSIAAFVVPLTAPTGWVGSPGAAKYVCAAWLCLVVAAAIARQPQTRLWFAMLVVTSAIVEFGSGWLGWWGGDDPGHPMVGTFYWHNPYAAFLMPGALLGLAFWVWQKRLFALLGIIAFTVGCIGIVYSTSRAVLATFVLGFAALTVMAIVDRHRWRSLRQVALAGILGAAATYAVGGPPFFTHRASPLAGEQARTAAQSLSQNGGYRLDFWHEAVTVFGRHPLTGGGYKSLVAESVGQVPSNYPLSPFAHNGYLQALAVGGLVLGLPFLVAAVSLAVVSVRSLVTTLRRRNPSVSGYAAPIALGCVLLHAGVDFDWAYPANLAMAGVLGGLVVGRRVADHLQDRAPVQRATAQSRPHRGLVLLGALLAGVALLGLSAWVSRNGDHKRSLPTASASS
jgi:O-antigen ligase